MRIKKLSNNIIFLTVAGSQLYGLNTPESDTDLRGVMLDPVDSLLGLTNFEQQEYRSFDNPVSEFVHMFTDIESDDVQIYGLRKFFKLLLENNPNILELLFADNIIPNYYGYIPNLITWETIQDHRDIFLSQKIRHTFAGYAYSQLHRIKNHKRWIDYPPLKPDPSDFGMILSEKGGQKWTDSNQYNKYQSLLKDYQSYLKWQTERNPKRKELETKFGYDTKHASHIYRLIFEAQELLQTGYLSLPLRYEYRDTIMDIKEGKVDYEVLLYKSEILIEELKTITSILPYSPNHIKAEELLININRDRLCSEH